MEKRDRFIAELRTDARAKGLSFRVDYRKGKGGHAMAYVGDKLTTAAEPGNRSQNGTQDQEAFGAS
jgi:hypothetical protein